MPGAVPCSNPPPYLPSAHSIHIKGIPSNKSETKYGIIKAPPPLLAACTGNRKKFPRPTAEPATAMMIPSLEPHESRLNLGCFVMGLLYMARPGFSIQKVEKAQS